MKLHEVAHYGRYYRYYNLDRPYWWYDKNQDIAVSIDEIKRDIGCESIDGKVRELRRQGLVSFFEADVLSIENQFAGLYLPKKYREKLSVLDDERYDYRFMEYIDNLGLLTKWYLFELEILEKQAKVWLENEKIQYSKDDT